VSAQRRIRPGEPGEPDIYFLPLALPEPKQFAGLDVGVLCRRIPDFLHQLINHGEPGLIGLLEIQPPLLEDPLDAADAFAMVPAGEEPHGVVTGALNTGHEGFELEMRVHCHPDPDRSMTLLVDVDVRNPMPALTRLASRLAGILEIPYHQPPAALLTHSTQAFYKFLQGLEGSAVLSGDLQVKPAADPETLMRPHAEALALDPSFGLALRVAYVSLVAALENNQIDHAASCRVLDGCLRALPTDGEACVQVAEHLHRLGEEERAVAWLEQAAGLPVPPAQALEALGILLSGRGRQDRARELWRQGAELDGHPDFCAHLARSAFDDGDVHEAWSQVERGLRRISERLAHPREWPEWQDGVGSGRNVAMLFRLVAEQLATYPATAGVAALLGDLRGQLALPEERVELGLCLLKLGLAVDGRTEVQAALAMGLGLPARDRAVRVMLTMDVLDFERRFAAAANAVRYGKNPGRGMRAMREFLIRQPEFWLGRYYLGVGLKRRHRQNEALDALAEVLQMRPGQAETLMEMAELFAARGNPKRALECVDEALLTRGREAHLHVRRAEYLEQLDRPAAAASAMARAVELGKSSELAKSSPLGDPL